MLRNTGTGTFPLPPLTMLYNNVEWNTLAVWYLTHEEFPLEGRVVFCYVLFSFHSISNQIRWSDCSIGLLSISKDILTVKFRHELKMVKVRVKVWGRV